jgi:hypothetical protein
MYIHVCNKIDVFILGYKHRSMNANIQQMLQASICDHAIDFSSFHESPLQIKSRKKHINSLSKTRAVNHIFLNITLESTVYQLKRTFITELD